MDKHGISLYNIVDQEVRAYPHLVRLQAPDGSFHIIDDPDLWIASKINATRKKTYASDIYFEKREQPKAKQRQFIEGVRDHSWNRLHMGALVIGGLDLELRVTSLVSKAIALGKFYKMQQQTRRGVILDETYLPNHLDQEREVLQSFNSRFELYRKICDERYGKIRGFDHYVQDVFKILPLSTMTRISGNWDLRVTLGYARWATVEYLPSSVKDFAQKLRKGVNESYPLMSQSFILSNRLDNDQQVLETQLRQIVGSDDLTDESLLWYNDHSLLLPKNSFFDKLYEKLQLQELKEREGPAAKFIGYYGPAEISTKEILELFNEKSEEIKSALELVTIAFASKIDLSGAIDTWRHTRNNRIVEPIYRAAERGYATISTPALFQRAQSEKTVQIRERIIEHSSEALALYHDLIGEGVPAKEAIHVLPHSLEIIQIELMDMFSFLNVVGLRSCIHARPEVQEWAKGLLKGAGEVEALKGIDKLNSDGILARGIQFGYCMELGTCRKCGKILYIPDPFR